MQKAEATLPSDRAQAEVALSTDARKLYAAKHKSLVAHNGVLTNKQNDFEKKIEELENTSKEFGEVPEGAEKELKKLEDGLKVVNGELKAVEGELKNLKEEEVDLDACFAAVTRRLKGESVGTESASCTRALYSAWEKAKTADTGQAKKTAGDWWNRSVDRFTAWSTVRARGANEVGTRLSLLWPLALSLSAIDGHGAVVGTRYNGRRQPVAK